MRIRECLMEDDGTTHTIAGDSSVEEAVNRLLTRGSGALVVLGNGGPVGLFTERDLSRCFARFNGRPYREIPLTDIVGDRLIAAGPDDAVSDSLSTMVREELHYLPVIDDGRVIGMLTIQELTRRLVTALTEELHQLQQYIDDLQDAVHD